MKQRLFSSQLYDNEAIGTFVLELVIRQVGEISLAKALLILPILLHDPIIKRISTKTVYRSIDEFLVKERINVGDVNGRLQNMLPLTVNCISILLDIGLIDQAGIILKALPQQNSSRLQAEIGERCWKIKKIIPKVAFLFQESDDSTYLKFNILL